MRKILQVAKREYKTSVRTKGFIIALVLMPVLMGGSGLAMYLFEGQVDTRDKKVATPGIKRWPSWISRASWRM
jgi:ABC-type Na+ efflux pump permease subunit